MLNYYIIVGIPFIGIISYNSYKCIKNIINENNKQRFIKNKNLIIKSNIMSV
jgi:hypothetical protein